LESIAVMPWDDARDEFELGRGTEQLDLLQALDLQPLGLIFYGNFELFLSAPSAL